MIQCFSVCRSPTPGRGVQFKFIIVAPLLLSCYGFFIVFGCIGYLLVGSSVFWLTISCDVGVSMRKDELTSFLFCHLVSVLKTTVALQHIILLQQASASFYEKLVLGNLQDE